MKNVMLLAGAGQIGMAIARRVGYGMKIVIGDKRRENAEAIADTMNKAGFTTVPVEMDLSSRASILALIDTAQQYGEISMLVNAAGVSPSQASIETILKVDLYGTAVLLEEVGKVISKGGVGVTVSSQSGHRMPALGIELDEQLATAPTEELLTLEALQPQNIRDTLHAYQMAKRCNVKRVMAEAVKWGNRGAQTYFVSVGPVQNDPYCSNAEIESFNAAMQANLSGVTYIDVYSHLVSEGFSTVDGTHYPDSVSVDIYNYILDHLEEQRSGIWG